MGEETHIINSTPHVTIEYIPGWWHVEWTHRGPLLSYHADQAAHENDCRLADDGWIEVFDNMICFYKCLHPKGGLIGVHISTRTRPECLVDKRKVIKP